MKKPLFMVIIATVVSALVTACSPGDRVEIIETAKRSPHRPESKLNVSSQERFQLAAMSRMPGGQTPEGPAQFHWETPEGWTALPATEFRAANFQIGPNGEGEAFMTILGAGGGGILANVNRWRSQMGLPEYTDAEFQQLSRFDVLGQEAVYVDFEGAYTGMGQTEAKPDHRMLGLLFLYGDSGVFLKMVGPKDLVAANESKFREFVGSLHPVSDGHTHGAEASAASGPDQAALPPDHPPVGEMPNDATHSAMAQEQTADGAQEPAETPKEDSSQGITWTVPEGWSKSPERPMRLVTYTIGDDKATEGYITVLGGGGGGALMNINRWLGQFGKAPLTDADVQALPKITVMGKEVPLVEAEGTFTTMQGQTLADQALLGAAYISDAESVFVKMTGPKDIVNQQKDNFTAFCTSLKQK